MSLLSMGFCPRVALTVHLRELAPKQREFHVETLISEVGSLVIPSTLQATFKRRELPFSWYNSRGLYHADTGFYLQRTMKRYLTLLYVFALLAGPCESLMALVYSFFGSVSGATMDKETTGDSSTSSTTQSEGPSQRQLRAGQRYVFSTG